jgi:nucleotide-binding universal stress UspA family protein
MKPIRTILVPLDFDASSAAALNEALRLAKQLGSRIVLIHVVPFALSDVDEDLFYATPNTSARNRTNAYKKMTDLIASLSEWGLDIVAEQREGIAWDEIVGAAARLEADLIVIGARPRTGLQRGLMGSVAERVVRASPVPVLTVRANAAQEERREFAAR